MTTKFKRGQAILVERTASSFSLKGGLSVRTEHRLAVVESVSRDGAQIRAYRLAGYAGKEREHPRRFFTVPQDKVPDGAALCADLREPFDSVEAAREAVRAWLDRRAAA